MIPAIIDINTDADGVRCGECEGPLYVKECDCCKPRTVCHGRMLDGKTREFVRGPECLAAASRAAAKDAMLDSIAAMVDDYFHAPAEESIADGVAAVLDLCHEQSQQLAVKDAEIARLREAGYVLAMRLLQQDTLVLDDTEIAARDLFLARASQVVAHAALEAKP